MDEDELLKMAQMMKAEKDEVIKRQQQLKHLFWAGVISFALIIGALFFQFISHK